MYRICVGGLRLAAMLGLAVSAVSADEDAAANACPNPAFADGFTHWDLAPAGGAITRASVDAPRHRWAADIDGTLAAGEAGLVSKPFAVRPSTRYCLGALVRRVSGDGPYKVSLEWLGADGRHLAYENSWTGVLAGTEWEHHHVDLVSPGAATSARILAGVRAGCHAQMTAFELTELGPAPPRLAVDLVAEPLPPAGGPWTLDLRLENRGGVKLEHVTVELRLPEGVEGPEAPLERVPELAPGEVWRGAIRLTGVPAADGAIRCRVTALAAGEEHHWSAETRPFVSTSVTAPRTADSLAPPQRPRSRVKLGCFYFPVMLDWDRMGWGVRRVPRMEPLLGFYDEALPRVADWHIAWAVEHGLSYFVFDWYYNQGQCYLNDALEKGFLRSRFADRMEFCVDWCNEGHCTDFRPLDFSDPSLDGFIRTLCERYFARPSYLRVGGKPVVLIHEAWRLANAHGGWRGCAEALDRMRSIARTYGHRGVYFVAVQNQPILAPFGEGGFDAVTAYAYGFCDVPWGGPDRSMPYDALYPRHDEAMGEARRRAHEQGLAYVPTAWVGWDDAARSNERAVRSSGNTPSAFRRMLELLPGHTDEHPGLALFESWNEWGEGGAAEPGVEYGFGRLDAIRDVLTDARGAHTDPVPTPAEHEAMQTGLSFDDVNEHYWGRYARHLGLDRGLRLSFDSVHDLWLRPSSGVVGVTIEGGLLRARAVGNDPSFAGPPCMGLPAESVREVVVTMSATAGTEAQIFWRTNMREDFTEAQSARFPITADGQMHEYRIDVSSSMAWSGRIQQFRLDPTNGPAEIAIDAFVAAPEEEQ